VAIYLHIIVWLWNDIYWRDLQEPAASSGHGRRHYAAMETNDRRQQQPAEFWLRTGTRRRSLEICLQRRSFAK
jgi:hypothetical protein